MLSLPLLNVVAIAGVACAAPAQAAAGSYPATAVMDALRGACPDETAVIAAQRSGAITGWTRVADPAATPIGPLVQFGREAGEKMLAGKGRLLGGMAVYRRTVAGEDLYLVLSGIETEGRTVRGCRLYDPAEKRAIDLAAATAWMKRAPTEAVDRPELKRLSWEPGFATGQDSFEVYFVPANSPVIALTKLDGVALKVDWLGLATGQPSSRTGSEEKK